MGKIVAIIQCRNGSTRLPNKGIVDLDGKPAIQYMVDRVKLSKYISNVIVATTENEKDKSIIDICKKNGIDYYTGSENDVLTRVLEAAQHYQADTIVELTGDCPLMHWDVLDRCIQYHLTLIDSKWYITTNVHPRSYPTGYDIRIYDTNTLEIVNEEVDNDVDREHVATWMYLNPKGKKEYFVNSVKAESYETRPDYAVTLDTPADLELIRNLIEYGKEYRLELKPNEVINALDTYPHLYQDVQAITRKDYYQELEEWNAKVKAEKVKAEVKVTSEKEKKDVKPKPKRKVQSTNSGRRKTSNTKRPTRKRKSK